MGHRHRVGGCGARGVTSALAPLRTATKLDFYRETAQIPLEPWLVEAAFGPSLPDPRSGRSADRREGHSYTSQGEVARMVERKSLIQVPPLPVALPIRPRVRLSAAI